MLKYVVAILCLYSAVAAAEPAKIVNIVSPEQPQWGTIPAGQVKNVVIDDETLIDMDRMAAQSGDDHAMGTLAFVCLNRGDYTCAYQWAGTALRGYYWRQQGMEDKIKQIKAEAKKHLSAKQISELDVKIKEFRPL